MTNTELVYFCLVFGMSIVTFLIYGFDKHRAANGNRRVPERTLHILALLGGWPGALLAQPLFRHKTQKMSFLIVFWILVVLHVALIGVVTYSLHGSPFIEAGSRIRPINRE